MGLVQFSDTMRCADIKSDVFGVCSVFLLQCRLAISQLHLDLPSYFVWLLEPFEVICLDSIVKHVQQTQSPFSLQCVQLLMAMLDTASQQQHRSLPVKPQHCR